MISTKFAISGEHYHKALETWKEMTGESSKNNEILQRELPLAVNKLIHEPRQPKHVFNILSVGSGDGANDLEVLQIVQAELQRDDKYRDMKMFNRAIEPNPYHVKLYNNSIVNLIGLLRDNTTFDVRAQTFEEYMVEESSNEDLATKFDIIHFVHSIYYLDIEATLKHCFEKELLENGKVVIIVGSFVTSVVSKCDSTESNTSVIPKSSKAEEAVREVAQKYGWKFEKYSQEYDIDLSEVFDEDSIKGNLLLDFIAQTHRLRATGDQTNIDQVVKSVEDRTTLKNGRHCGKKFDAVLILSN